MAAIKLPNGGLELLPDAEWCAESTHCDCERMIDQPSLLVNVLYEVLLLEKHLDESRRFAQLPGHVRDCVGVIFLDVARHPTHAQAIQDEHQCFFSRVGLRYRVRNASGGELRQARKQCGLPKFGGYYSYIIYTI